MANKEDIDIFFSNLDEETKALVLGAVQQAWFKIYNDGYRDGSTDALNQLRYQIAEIADEIDNPTPEVEIELDGEEDEGVVLNRVPLRQDNRVIETTREQRNG